MLAYPKLRKQMDTQVLKRVNESDREKLLGTIAEMILNHPTIHIPVYGVFPPLGVFEEIPEDDAKSFRISGDATKLTDFDNPARLYKNLAIKKTDLKRRLREGGR